MYKLCKTEQSAKRQKLLEKGLLEAMHSQCYEDISVSDLCQKMGISRKSFYRYFSGKEGALEALLEHTLMEFGTFCMSGEESITPEKYLENFFVFWRGKEIFLEALEKSKLTAVLVRKTLDFAVHESSVSGRFLPGEVLFMKEQAIRFYICGIMSMALAWHRCGYQQSPQQMANVALRLVTRPLISDEHMVLY